MVRREARRSQFRGGKRRNDEAGCIGSAASSRATRGELRGVPRQVFTPPAAPVGRVCPSARGRACGTPGRTAARVPAPRRRRRSAGPGRARWWRRGAARRAGRGGRPIIISRKSWRATRSSCASEGADRPLKWPPSCRDLPQYRRSPPVQLLECLRLRGGVVDEAQHRLLEKRGRAGGAALRNLPFDHALKLIGKLNRTRRTSVAQ
jgi:hypothetical protein